MGIPLKRRALEAMYFRWKLDQARLEQLFGDYGEDDYSDGAEIQRNLGTAIEYASRYVTKHKPR